jgi:hypothetical protein
LFAPFSTTAAHHLLDAIRNDSCQLQAFGVVVTDPVDIDELSENGMSFEEFDGKIVDDKFLIIKANVLTNRVDVMESPLNYCLDRFDDMYGDRDKGLFIAFQVAIKGTGQQHDIRPNGIAAKNWGERERLQQGVALMGAASPNRLVALQLSMRPFPPRNFCMLGRSARLGSAWLGLAVG